MHSDDELIPQGSEHVDWTVEPDGPVLVPYGTEFVEPPAVVPVVRVPEKRGGRPFAFTEAKQETYLECIRNGDGRELAAHNTGIHPDTVRAHRARFPEFEAEIIAAENVRNEKVVNALFVNATVNMNATAQVFWVTNRMPEAWQDKRGPRVLQQINGGPSVEWSLAEARAEAQGVLDEVKAKREQKAAGAPIEAESREADDGV